MKSLRTKRCSPTNSSTEASGTPPPKIQESFATARYLYYRQPNTSGIFPTKETGSFTRYFGDQLIAVKRQAPSTPAMPNPPSYYAAVFVGKQGVVNNTYKSIYQLREISRENQGGTFSPRLDPNDPTDRTERMIISYLGGGLSLVWTPAYGTSLLATNWAPTTHHGLVATKSDGKRYWEDGSATQFQLDNNVLKITGNIETLPINYIRLYDFRDNEIVVSLQLTATTDTELTKLVEILPFAGGEKAKPNTQIQVPGESAGKAVTNSLKVVNSTNSGMEVFFDQSATVNVQRNGFKFGYNDLQINRVEIVLPSKLQKDKTVTLNYRLRPTGAEPAKDPVPTLTATPADRAVTLNWWPVEKATGYNIKRGLISGQPNCGWGD